MMDGNVHTFLYLYIYSLIQWLMVHIKIRTYTSVLLLTIDIDVAVVIVFYITSVVRKNTYRRFSEYLKNILDDIIIHNHNSSVFKCSMLIEQKTRS